MKYLKLYEEFYDTRYGALNKKIALNCTLINSEKVENTGDIWEIWRNKDDLYLLTFNKIIADFEYEKINIKRSEIYELYNKGEKKYFTLKKLLNKMSSYDFQKEFLKEHPQRIKELEPFGYNEKIKEEFKHLFVGKEWGFFDLKGDES